MPSVSAAQHRAMEAAAHSITDYSIACEIRDGNLSSPQRVGNFWLFDLRITGTGAAYRTAHDEYAFRDPADWLTEDFIERCNGLAVVFEHPDGGALNSDDYRERSIGSVVLPYRKNDEIWGIAKVFDEDAAALMQTTHMSTSPGVVTPPSNHPVDIDDDTTVLLEQSPLILDHIAVVPAGVWDKGGPPTGIRNDAAMAEKEGERKYGDVKFADPANDKYPIDTDEHIRAAWDYIHKEKDADKYSVDDLAAIKQRIVDAWKDKIDSSGPPEANSRKDTAMADDKSENGKDVAETRDNADDLKARLDAAVKDRDELKERLDAMTSRMDAWEADKRADDARKDASGDAEPKDVTAPEKPVPEAEIDARKDENVDANKGTPIADAVDNASLKAEIDRLRNQMASLVREPTFDDREQIAHAHRRADGIYQMLGQRAPEAMAGEGPLAYRRRLAAKLQKHSAKFQNFRLDASVDPSAFDLIESQIYADAEKAARTPDNMPAGRLIPHTTTELGKTYTRFYGDSAAAWSPFMPPVRNSIAGFDKRAGKV